MNPNRYGIGAGSFVSTDPNSSFFSTLAFATITFLTTAWFVGLPLLHESGDPLIADGHKYYHMAAGNVGSFHIAPFCWRIGVPSLAWLSSLPDPLNFQIINFWAVFITGWVIFRIAEMISGNSRIALVSVIWLFTTGCIFHYAASWCGVVDPVVPMFFAVAIMFALKARWLPFALTIAIGVVFKESVLAVAPVYYLINASKWIDGKVLLKTLPGGLIGLGIHLTFRYFIPAHNGDPIYESSLPAELLLPGGEYSMGNLWDQFGATRLDHLLELPIYWGETFGLLSALVLIGTFLRPNVLRILIPVAGLLTIQLFFASGTHRLLSVMYPFFVFALLPVLEWLVKARTWLLLPFGLAGLSVMLLKILLIAPPYRYSPKIFLMEFGVVAVVFLTTGLIRKILWSKRYSIGEESIVANESLTIRKNA